MDRDGGVGGITPPPFQRPAASKTLRPHSPRATSGSARRTCNTTPALRCPVAGWRHGRRGAARRVASTGENTVRAAAERLLQQEGGSWMHPKKWRPSRRTRCRSNDATEDAKNTNKQEKTTATLNNNKKRSILCCISTEETRLDQWTLESSGDKTIKHRTSDSGTEDGCFTCYCGCSCPCWWLPAPPAASATCHCGPRPLRHARLGQWFSPKSNPPRRLILYL